MVNFMQITTQGLAFATTYLESYSSSTLPWAVSTHNNPAVPLGDRIKNFEIKATGTFDLVKETMFELGQISQCQPENVESFFEVIMTDFTSNFVDKWTMDHVGQCQPQLFDLLPGIPEPEPEQPDIDPPEPEQPRNSFLDLLVFVPVLFLVIHIVGCDIYNNNATRKERIIRAICPDVDTILPLFGLTLRSLLADPRDAKRQMRRTIFRHHPDRNHGSEAEATNKTAELNRMKALIEEDFLNDLIDGNLF